VQADLDSFKIIVYYFNAVKLYGIFTALLNGASILFILLFTNMNKLSYTLFFLSLYIIMSRIIIDDKEILDRLKQIKNYPLCKIIDYEYYIKLNKYEKYVDIKSKNQIGTLINRFRQNRSGVLNYHSFLGLLLKHVEFKYYDKYTNILLHNKYNDFEIYKILRNYIKQHKKPARQIAYVCDRDTFHAQNVYYNITRNIADKSLVIDKFFDFGCGECITTKRIGEMFGLDKDHIYGADIPNWGDYTDEKRQKNDIILITLEENKKIPIEDNFFPIISAMMVLHHVKDLMFVLKELNRITKLGGYIYVREHDAFTNSIKMLCDIEHAMFEVVQRKNDNFFEDYYGEYYNWIEWLVLFKRAGFEYVYSDFDYTSAYQTISPTRPYYCIYKKIR